MRTRLDSYIDTDTFEQKWGVGVKTKSGIWARLQIDDELFITSDKETAQKERAIIRKIK